MRKATKLTIKANGIKIGKTTPKGTELYTEKHIGSTLDGKAIYAKDKTVTLPLSRYRSDRDSQIEFVKVLLSAFNGYTYTDDYGESSYDEPEKLITIKNKRDYGLVWGNGRVLEDDGEYIDGKLDNYNDSVVDEFWSFGLQEYGEGYFKEIDPDETITVYHRKGKDWYVDYSTEEEDAYICYWDDESREMVEDDYIILWSYKVNTELQQQFVDIIKDWRQNCEVQGYVYNELRIGADSYYGEPDYQYNDDIFNLKMIDNQCDEDRYEYAREIVDLVDWSDKSDAKILVAAAYENWLTRNMEDGKLLKTYTHLKIIEKLAKQDDKELVYSRVGDFAGVYSYAIKFKNQEYHFSLGELFNSNPVTFYSKINESLSKRLREIFANSILLQKAQSVFVGLEDSAESGNCDIGTKQFCQRHGVDLGKIGGIRGDALLELDFSSFTKRAVMQAINRSEVA